MKVSLKWLNELVKIDDIPTETLTKMISLYSIEIDGISTISDATNVVVGYVVKKDKHPSADKLSVCQVKVQDELLQIVCGAPNVDQGQLVVVAIDGATLPGDFKIKKNVIRGIESKGMICSLKELGLEKKYVPEEFQDGIYVLDEDAKEGENALTYLGFDDVILELGLTPNRSDLLSIRGVANDVAAVLDRQIEPMHFELQEQHKLATSEVSVENYSENCLVYYAKIIKDVEIKPSPNWLKSRLIASGIRPINNIVDITNYILMLFGQPLHAFDQAKVGKNIVIRDAFSKEKTVTLDGETRQLLPTDVVITNGLEVVAIAGVMGCKNTEISSTTKDIILEAAVFAPLSVRKTSARLGLRSESSTRFERGVDINQTKFAADYACYLLSKYASGKVLKNEAFTGVEHISDKEISITNQYVERSLGIKIKTSDIVNILHRLGFKSRVKEDYITAIIPNRRLDVNIKEDLIEEIGRIHGYEKLPLTLPKVEVNGELTIAQKRVKVIRKSLSGLGLKEVVTYSLTSQADVDKFNYNHIPHSSFIKLMNPMSEEREVLRMGLLKSILDSIRYNEARRINDMAFFEIGNRYYQINNQACEDLVLAGALTGELSSTKWSGNSETIDFFVVKGIINNLLFDLGLKAEYRKITKECKELHPNRSAEILVQGEVIGFVGEIHPKVARLLDITDVYVFEIILGSILGNGDSSILYKEISKYPSVERDLAFVISNKVVAGEVLKSVYETDKLYIQQVDIFDIYRGEKLDQDEYSIAIRVTFQANETLNEDSISQKTNQIVELLGNKYNAKLRNF